MMAIFKTLISMSNGPERPSITQREKIRLTCFDAPALANKKAHLITTKAENGYLNDLLAGSTVTIKRITKARHGRTVAELWKDKINIQEALTKKALHASMKDMTSNVSGIRDTNET